MHSFEEHSNESACRKSDRLGLEQVYYKAIGFKKMSSDEDIGVALRKAKKGFFVIGRTHHPDKTEDKQKIELFKKAKEQYELQNKAFETLGTLNIMGNDYADRVIYDIKGGELHSKVTAVFEERYPDITFSQRATDIKLEAERAKIFSKGQATRVKKKGMDALQDVSYKWNNDGHQENFSRTAILTAFDEGHTRTEVICHIRLEVYNSTKKPWDDVVLGNSRWTKIERSIDRIWKAHKNNRLDYLRGTGGRNGTQEDYDTMS